MTDRRKTNRRKAAYHITRATKGAFPNIVARVAVAALLGAGLTFPTIALAQMLPDVAEKIAAIGRVVDPELDFGRFRRRGRGHFACGARYGAEFRYYRGAAGT